jgi:hypothetical protein
MANSKKKKRNQRKRRPQQQAQKAAGTAQRRQTGFHTADQLADDYVNELFDMFQAKVERGEIPVGGWQFYELLLPTNETAGIHGHEAAFQVVSPGKARSDDPMASLIGFTASKEACGLAFVGEFPDTPTRRFCLAMRDGRFYERYHDPDDPEDGVESVGEHRLPRLMLNAVGVQMRAKFQDNYSHEEQVELAAHMAYQSGHLELNPSEDADHAIADQFNIVMDTVALASSDPKGTLAVFERLTRDSVKEHRRGNAKACLLCKGELLPELQERVTGQRPSK